MTLPLPATVAGATRAAVAPPPAQLVKPTLPGYEILRELGRGGMGVVYLAKQKGLNRLVALKMILAGEHAGSQELARFRREAEAVAQLRHPGIVHIYEIGEQQGRPYFSLEFLEGGSLAQRLAGAPQPGRAAAQMVEGLARAVHHAHQQGIVHRDLKPANVLLTREGAPKLTDFGLVKHVEDSSDTRTGAVVGTPSYIAPEQAAGKKDVGPSADIYALGAILYEMLTGRPPFRGESPMDTMLQVIKDEPVPPRRLQPKAARDLETICMKCLQKQPAKRYSNAEALADDLQRFQKGEPIQARPIKPHERLWRWSLRNPMVAGLSAALVAVMVLAFGLVTVQWARAEKQKKIAEANYQKARQAVNDFYVKVSENELLKAPGMQELRKDLLQTALGYYKEFAQQHGDDRSLQADLGRVYLRIGMIQEQMGAYAEAMATCEKALPLLQKASAADPANVELTVALGDCHWTMGILGIFSGRSDGSRRSLQSALEVLRRGAEKWPTDPRFTSRSVQIHLELGQLEASAGRIDEALATFRQLVRDAEKTVQSNPTDRPKRHMLAYGEYLLGQLLYEAGQAGEAATHLQRAREVSEKVDRSIWLHTLLVLGNLSRDSNQPADALRHYETVRAWWQRYAEENPKLVLAQHHLGRVNFHIGLLNQRYGNAGPARNSLERAVSLLEPLSQGEQVDREARLDLGRTLVLLAANQRQSGRASECLATAQRARDTMDKVIRVDPEYMDAQSELASAWQEIGRAQETMGRRAEALTAYQKTLELQQVPFGRAPKIVAYGRYLSSHYADLGRLHRSAGQFAAVASLMQDRQKRYPTNSGQLYETAKELALTAAEMGRGRPLSPTEDADRKRYADQAMTALRAAVQHGFKDAIRVQGEPAFAFIRNRPDFQALVNGMRRG